MMSETLSEEEMRRALFGSATQSSQQSIAPQPRPKIPSAPPANASIKKRLSSRLRVTLHVTKVFEGPQEVFVHDANTLSTLVAEAEAKAAAKKQKFRYCELVSFKPVQV